MIEDVERTLEEKLDTVQECYDEAAALQTTLQELLGDMEALLSQAEDAARDAQRIVDEYVSDPDAEDWLPLLEESNTDEIHELVEKIRQMLP